MIKEDRIGKVYDAKWYHMILFGDWLRRRLQRPQSFLPEMVADGMTVVDIGCGLGLYSIELAKLVGETGKVLAVDLQAEMLKLAQKKAGKAGFADKIEFIQCRKDDIKVPRQVDFALTMWVVHEMPDRRRFFKQLYKTLKPNGSYLLAEPKFHITKALYKIICNEAEDAGFRPISQPKVALSYAALFERSSKLTAGPSEAGTHR